MTASTCGIKLGGILQPHTGRRSPTPIPTFAAFCVRFGKITFRNIYFYPYKVIHPYKYVFVKHICTGE
jgi:hypothetical protein